MNCLDFLDRLADLAAGLASPAEQAEAERHASGCPECAELLRVARRGGRAFAGRSEDEEAPDFVEAVLARTGGSACGRAEDLLCDYVDDELPAEDRALVAEHLAHCGRCAALADALREATAVLPLLAEIEPDSDFTLQVLRATSRGARPAPTPVWSRVTGWWERAIARPRFAFEVAYVATLLLLLVVGNPAATVQAASRHSLEASARLEQVRVSWSSALSEAVASSPAWQAAQRTAESLRSMRARSDQGPGFWSRLADGCASAWQWLRGVMSSAIDTVADGWTRIRDYGTRWFAPTTEPQRDEARSRG